MNNKIYISGKITGLSRHKYLSNFRKVERKLLKLGYTPINPARVNDTLPRNTNYESYMNMSICMLSFCDTIYMMSNWKDSNGARIEHDYAKRNNYKIIYE